MLRESAPRQGFLEHPDFEKLMQHLPKHLKGPVLFGYRSGWRLGEVRGLRWSYVDRAKGIVTLPVGSTKNGAGRTLYLDDELRAMIESLWEARKDSGRLTPWVFLNAAATGQLGSFRKAWATACGKAGIGDKLFHDLRRTACRNMVRAGIPERVAMMVSGHKTRSIFDRYNVVSESDLRAAAEKQAGYLAEIRSAASTLTSTLAHFPPKTEPACNPVSVCDSIGSVSARP
jgi:integrase